MAFYMNGATHEIERSGEPMGVTTWPLTMFGRIRVPGGNDGLNHVMLVIAPSNVSHGHRIMVSPSGGNLVAQMSSITGSGAATASSSTNHNDSNWHTVIGQATADNARQVWLDNAGNTSNAGSRPMNPWSRTLIGRFESGGGSFNGNVNHELADIAAWAAAPLTADERAALHAGISPLKIRPQSLILYVPLISRANDRFGGPFNVVGATVVPHPRVFMPRNRRR